MNTPLESGLSLPILAEKFVQQCIGHEEVRVFQKLDGLRQVDEATRRCLIEDRQRAQDSHSAPAGIDPMTLLAARGAIPDQGVEFTSEVPGGSVTPPDEYATTGSRQVNLYGMLMQMRFSFFLSSSLVVGHFSSSPIFPSSAA